MTSICTVPSVLISGWFTEFTNSQMSIHEKLPQINRADRSGAGYQGEEGHRKGLDLQIKKRTLSKLDLKIMKV